MSVQPVDIQILGKTLRVNCPIEQQEALKESVFDLENRLKDLKCRTGVTKIEQLIFIVALNICHELTQEKIKVQDYISNMEKKIKLLKKIIEQISDEQKNIKDRILEKLG